MTRSRSNSDPESVFKIPTPSESSKTGTIVDAPGTPGSTPSGWSIVDPHHSPTITKEVQDPYGEEFHRNGPVIAMYYTYVSPYKLTSECKRERSGDSGVFVYSSFLYHPHSCVTCCQLREIIDGQILPRAQNWTKNFRYTETYRTAEGPTTVSFEGGCDSLLNIGSINKYDENETFDEDRVEKGLEELRKGLRKLTDHWTKRLEDSGWNCTVEAHNLDTLRKLCESLASPSGESVWVHYAPNDIPASILVETHMPHGLDGKGTGEVVHEVDDSNAEIKT